MQAKQIQSTSQWTVPDLPKLTDADLLTYLRRTRQVGAITKAAQQRQWLLSLCQEFEITISDEDWQSAGDRFRTESQILSASETFTWLEQQQLTLEDWSEGIREELLIQALKEQVLGRVIDTHYLSHRNDYKRVALSQILVDNAADALTIANKIRTHQASLTALALDYSLGKQSREQGGFAGICFMSELLPEIANSLAGANVGDVIGPLQTSLGYHILRVEKWFPPQLDEANRNRILNVIFEQWVYDLQKTKA